MPAQDNGGMRIDLRCACGNHMQVVQPPGVRVANEFMAQITVIPEPIGRRICPVCRRVAVAAIGDVQILWLFAQKEEDKDNRIIVPSIVPPKGLQK